MSWNYFDDISMMILKLQINEYDILYELFHCQNNVIFCSKGGYAIPQFVDRGQQQAAPARFNNLAAARILPTNVANYHDVRRQEGSGPIGRQDGNTGGGPPSRQQLANDPIRQGCQHNICIILFL